MEEGSGREGGREGGREWKGGRKGEEGRERGRKGKRRMGGRERRRKGTLKHTQSTRHVKGQEESQKENGGQRFHPTEAMPAVTIGRRALNPSHLPPDNQSSGKAPIPTAILMATRPAQPIDGWRPLATCTHTAQRRGLYRAGRNGDLAGKGMGVW